jgi:hypothetical protein
MKRLSVYTLYNTTAIFCKYRKLSNSILIIIFVHNYGGINEKSKQIFEKY